MQTLRNLLRAPLSVGSVLLLALCAVAALVAFGQGFEFLSQLDQARSNLVDHHFSINQLSDEQVEILVINQIWVLLFFVAGIFFSTLATAGVLEIRRAGRYR